MGEELQQGSSLLGDCQFLPLGSFIAYLKLQQGSGLLGDCHKPLRNFYLALPGQKYAETHYG